MYLGLGEPEVLDAVIVGGGIMGAALFHELAGRNRKVLLVEQDRIGLGTTAWSGGIVRCYHDDPVLVDRSILGLSFYREFSRRTGIHVAFNRTGFLYIPHPSRLEHARMLTDRIAQSAPAEWLSGADAERRFGHVLSSSVEGAVWEPQAGYLDALETTRALVRAGVRKGGRVLEGVRVDGLTRTGGRVRGVRGTAGEIPADAVVLAAGAHTPRLLDSWGVRHDLWAQAIQVELRSPNGSVADHPAYMDDVYDVNGRPDPDSAGMLLGHPTGYRIEGPVGRTVVDPDQSRLALKAGARRFGWVGGSASLGGFRAAECYAPKGRARVAWVPGEAGLMLVTGFNGGGFKMAPWAAEEAARLLGDR
ncbi:NAD(P)/FAD-dependent oxidoreductase [Streptomyces broussonetiae]|uniref:FAD-dependent oxidoreductase n=1 Tax=Streptomyces broussonetiae TaxID=2686304 RepID=A0A6I6NDH7_9ACTN|nr:FAD-dependent oxidoreductase [Streptomyces broussonetiae]QHA08060.1 FAD-dependent oxidoreductase [Streptomyces broussonetiae]